MRALLFLIPLLLLSGVSNAQISTVTLESAKTYAKASTVTDTSSTVTVGAYPYACIQTTSTGSDSSAISVAVDALINGVWSNTVTSAALQLGRPSAHTLESTKGQVSQFILREGSRIADLLQGANQIRVRFVHSSSAGDSTSALTYTSKLILRRP
jgi:hypothetical protein